MTILASFASAKHAPGTTTACLAVALALTKPSAVPRRRFRGQRAQAPAEYSGDRTVLVVEADPSGGDLAARLERRASGLETLAPAARHVVDEELVLTHAQSLRRGLALLAAPLCQASTAAALSAVGERLADHLRGATMQTLVDCGRLAPGSSALSFASASELILWVSRPTAEDAAHIQDRVQAIDAVAPGTRERSRLLVLNAGEYGVDEFARQVNVPVFGTLPYDPRGVDVLYGRQSGGGTELLRDARIIARALQDRPGHSRAAEAVARAADPRSFVVPHVPGATGGSPS